MLESIKRAYDNNLFENHECPIDLKTLEIYLQILAPAYRVSLAFQKNSSSISDTIPGNL